MFVVDNVLNTLSCTEKGRMKHFHKSCAYLISPLLSQLSDELEIASDEKAIELGYQLHRVWGTNLYILTKTKVAEDANSRKACVCSYWVR